MSPIAIIDFETTGISPNMGDRATEVAIVMLEGGQVVDRFQSLALHSGRCWQCGRVGRCAGRRKRGEVGACVASVEKITPKFKHQTLDFRG